MSGPTAVAAVAAPLAASRGQSPLECRGCASRRPASGFAPDAPVAADSILAEVDLRSPASALGVRSEVGRRWCRPLAVLPWGAPPHATLLLCSLDHRSPPSVRLFAPGFRVRTSP